MLEIVKLTFGWHSILLKQVYARLNSGDLVWLQGDNGCGKTTLLKIMSGMIPHFSRGHILEGDVRIENQSLIRNPPKTFFPYIAYLPSKNSEFYLLNTTLEQEMSLIRAMLPKVRIRARYFQICSVFPMLESLSKKPIQQMTLFEKRLALLTVFFLQKAQLYFMDEILSGFSKEKRDLWIQFLVQLKQDGCAVVLASHENFSEEATIWNIRNQTLEII